MKHAAAGTGERGRRIERIGMYWIKQRAFECDIPCKIEGDGVERMVHLMGLRDDGAVFGKSDRKAFSGDWLFRHLVDDALDAPGHELMDEQEFDAAFNDTLQRYGGVEIEWPIKVVASVAVQ